MRKPEGLTDEEFETLARRSLDCPYLRGAFDLVRNGRTWESALAEVAMLLSLGRTEMVKAMVQLHESAPMRILVTAPDSARRGAGEAER